MIIPPSHGNYHCCGIDQWLHRSNVSRTATDYKGKGGVSTTLTFPKTSAPGRPRDQVVISISLIVPMVVIPMGALWLLISSSFFWVLIVVAHDSVVAHDDSDRCPECGCSYRQTDVFICHQINSLVIQWFIVVHFSLSLSENRRSLLMNPPFRMVHPEFNNSKQEVQ